MAKKSQSLRLLILWRSDGITHFLNTGVWSNLAFGFLPSFGSHQRLTLVENVSDNSFHRRITASNIQGGSQMSHDGAILIFDSSLSEGSFHSLLSFSLFSAFEFLLCLLFSFSHESAFTEVTIILARCFDENILLLTFWRFVIPIRFVEFGLIFSTHLVEVEIIDQILHLLLGFRLCRLGSSN